MSARNITASPLPSEQSGNLSYKRLRLCAFEYGLIVAMLVIFGLVYLDTQEGQSVGRSPALEIARQQAKPPIIVSLKPANTP